MVVQTAGVVSPTREVVWIQAPLFRHLDRMRASGGLHAITKIIKGARYAYLNRCWA